MTIINYIKGIHVHVVKTAHLKAHTSFLMTSRSGVKRPSPSGNTQEKKKQEGYLKKGSIGVFFRIRKKNKRVKVDG